MILMDGRTLMLVVFALYVSKEVVLVIGSPGYERRRGNTSIVAVYIHKLNAKIAIGGTGFVGVRATESCQSSVANDLRW
jgi:hypothetical protein